MVMGLGRLLLIPVAMGALLCAACAPAAPTRPAATPLAPAATAPASGAAAQPPTPAPAASPPELRPVTLGTSLATSFAPLFMAHEKGYYREQGLELNLQPLAGGTDVVTQTASGHFDVGAGGMGAGMFNAFARGIRLTMVAPLTVLKPPSTNVLVGSKLLADSGELRRIADLRGRKVSIIAKGASNEYVLDQALRRDGLTFRDVDLQLVPAPEASAALANGAIAGSLVPEPFASGAVSRGAAVLLSNDFVDNLLVTTVYFNETFARTRREDGVRFLTAFLRAMREMEPPYRDEDLAIIAQYTGQSPETIRSSAPPAYDPTLDLHLDQMEDLQRFVIGLGETTYQEPLDLRQFTDPSFGQAALQRLGLPRN